MLINMVPSLGYIIEWTCGMEVHQYYIEYQKHFSYIHRVYEISCNLSMSAYVSHLNSHHQTVDTVPPSFGKAGTKP